LPNVLPMIDIGVFGVNGSRYILALEKCDSVMMSPRLKKYPADRGMMAYAEAAESGENPTMARENEDGD